LKKDDVNNTHTALPWNKQVQMEAMKQLYTKVIGITSQHSENEESKDVTWEHINCGVDKLAEMLRNFDDSKILYKCYEILPSQTSRQPLNQILQGLLAEKENLQKEVEKGYEDAYEASKEKSMLKKNHQQNLVQVKTNYEASLNAEKKTYQEKIEEKNKKIGELEKKVEELQAENARHLICKHRKTPKYIQTPQSQTPRKNVPKQISFTQSKISQVKKK
jgi:polyribonucleotide nucleotidyltransferase